MRAVVAHVHVLRVLGVGAEVRVGPVEAADDLARPGVEQQLVRVEAVAAVGAPGAVRTQAVDQARRRRRAGSRARRRRSAPAGAAAPSRCCRSSSYRHSSTALACAENDGEVDAALVAVRAQRPGAARLQQRLLPGQAVHLKNTVASGGRVSTMDCAWPCAGTCSLRAARHRRADVAAAVVGRVGVQPLAPGAGCRHAQAHAVVHHGREVAHHQQHVAVAAPAHEAEACCARRRRGRSIRIRRC